MSNKIFEKARVLRQMMADRGLWVGDLSTSTNRYGEHSAYFAIQGHNTIRVSDHACNTDCRVAEINWWGDTSPELVDAFVARHNVLIAEAAERAALRQQAEIEAQQHRRAAYSLEQAKKADNEALLAAHGLSGLVGTRRKDALRRLRGSR